MSIEISLLFRVMRQLFIWEMLYIHKAFIAFYIAFSVCNLETLKECLGLIPQLGAIPNLKSFGLPSKPDVVSAIGSRGFNHNDALGRSGFYQGSRAKEETVGRLDPFSQTCESCLPPAGQTRKRRNANCARLLLLHVLASSCPAPRPPIARLRPRTLSKRIAQPPMDRHYSA